MDVSLLEQVEHTRSRDRLYRYRPLSINNNMASLTVVRQETPLTAFQDYQLHSFAASEAHCKKTGASSVTAFS